MKKYFYFWMLWAFLFVTFGCSEGNESPFGEYHIENIQGIDLSTLKQEDVYVRYAEGSDINLIPSKGDVTVIDTVAYHNLQQGVKYTLSGILMDKDSKEEVKVNGKHEILSVNIKPEVVDPDDVEILSDMVVAAANEALRKASETMEQKMGSVTSGLGLPAGLGF